MRILIDVCLSPQWVEVLQRGGVDAVHWTSVGSPCAKDREIIEWTREQDRIVFTHDLDFGAILALTRASGPSVLQVRAQDVFPSAIGAIVHGVLAAHRDALEEGAIVSVDETPREFAYSRYNGEPSNTAMQPTTLRVAADRQYVISRGKHGRPTCRRANNHRRK